MTPESIVVLATEFGAPGGIQAVTRDVITTLAAGSAPVRVVSLLDRPEARALLPSNVHVSGASGGRVRFCLAASAAALHANGRTLVVALHAHVAPLALPMVARGAELIIFIYGAEIWRPLTTAERAAFRRAARLVAISAYTARRFQEANPWFDGPIHVCHLSAREDAPDLATVDPPRPDRVTGFALLVGRMSVEERYKGHDLLIELWARIRRTESQAVLVIAGDGDDRARLEQKARDAGLGKAVRFVGTVSDAVLHRLYEDSAFFLMPSKGEGFGLVFLESMRAGRPCIGAVGAASEVIEDGVTGFVVDPDRPEELERAIVRLFADPALRRRMGQAGRERFQRLFTFEQFQQRLRGAMGTS
jgi:phosphatidyl-myo-inositol dimannoside synthase